MTKENWEAGTLDADLRDAIDAVIATVPSESQSADAVRRIGSNIRTLQTRDTGERCVPERRSLNRDSLLIRFTTAATLVFPILWFCAQTEAWGQVVQTYQEPVEPITNSSQAVPENVEPSEASIMNLVGPFWRFVLIVHIASLTLGLVGMLFYWATSMWRWLKQLSGAGHGNSNADRAPRFSMTFAICVGLYGIGLGLGCVWAMNSWGVWWQWDPREAFALLTFGVATNWWLADRGMSGSSSESTEYRRALLASISMWLIGLMYVLSPMYVQDVHAYRRPEGLPMLMTGLLFGNTLVIAVVDWFRRSGRATPATG